MPQQTGVPESPPLPSLPTLSPGFTAETQPHIRNLLDFFTASKPQQHARLAYLKDRPSLKLAAVLVLIFERDGHLRVVLTTRAKTLRTHGGETALPGGRMDDEDSDIVTTALREANEEISLPTSSPHISVLGTLEPHTFHALTVVPVVALLVQNTLVEDLKPNPGEVDHIFSHPLEAIVDPALAPALEPGSLVEHGADYWPYAARYHHHQDYVVQKLGGVTYRLHCFQTSASPLTGFTSDILIQLAETIYRRAPQYERYASDQLRGYDAIVEAYRTNQAAARAVQT